MVSTMISDAKGMLIQIKCKRLAEATDASASGDRAKHCRRAPAPQRTLRAGVGLLGLLPAICEPKRTKAIRAAAGRLGYAIGARARIFCAKPEPLSCIYAAC